MQMLNRSNRNYEIDKRNLSPIAVESFDAGYISLLENNLSEYYEKEYALTFTNATQALFFLCIALNIKDSQIITTPFSWGGSIAPFLFFNNKILFSEIGMDNYCLNPKKLKKSMSLSTKLLLSVDYCGNPADTKGLKKYCVNNDIILVSDSSQSFGAYYENKPAGYFADIIVISFGEGKPLYGGEGGALLTSDESLYKSLLWISQHPQRQKKYFGLSYLNQFGLNGRLNPLAAKYIVQDWENSLTRLTIKQNDIFTYYNYLVDNSLIKPKKFLKHSNSSTFYIPVFEVKPGITLNELIEEFNRINSRMSIHPYQIQLLNEDTYLIDNYSHLSKQMFNAKYREYLLSLNLFYLAYKYSKC